MLRRTMTSMLVLAVAASTINQISAQEKATERVEIKKIADVLTLWSVGGEPRANATQSFVITHGLGGVDDRFFDLGKGIRAQDPQANVFVVDWSPGAKKKIGPVPNPRAAAVQIDPTGDALGTLLAKLGKKGHFDPAKATFIGESFGNYVNNQAGVTVAKSMKKCNRILVLNPASAAGGYQPPLVKATFAQSVVFVSESWLDTRESIANKSFMLQPGTDDAFKQHTYGMQFVQDKVNAGKTIDSLFAADMAVQMAPSIKSLK